MHWPEGSLSCDHQRSRAFWGRFQVWWSSWGRKRRRQRLLSRKWWRRAWEQVDVSVCSREWGRVRGPRWWLSHVPVDAPSCFPWSGGGNGNGAEVPRNNRHGELYRRRDGRELERVTFTVKQKKRERERESGIWGGAWRNQDQMMRWGWLMISSSYFKI